MPVAVATGTGDNNVPESQPGHPGIDTQSAGPILFHRLFLFQHTRFRKLVGHILHGCQRDQKTA